MAENHGTITVTGVESVLRASYSRKNGISPDPITVIATKQSSPIPQYVDVVWRYNDTVIQMQNCRVFSIEEEADTIRIYIADSRWVWQYGCVWGDYKKNGLASRKTPSEYAEILLNSMGCNIGTLQGLEGLDEEDAYWDFENPADMLSNLCSIHDAKIAQSLDGTVYIIDSDYGEQISDDGGEVLESPTGVSTDGVPPQLAVITAPSMHRIAIAMEPVGLDVDGKYKPLDELFYKPDKGWYCWDSIYTAWAQAEKKARDIYGANYNDQHKTVFRTYRVIDISKLPGGELVVPGFDDPITDTRQILPMLSVIEKDGNDEDDEDIQKQSPAWAMIETVRLSNVGGYITWYNEWKYAKEGPDTFSLDRENGILTIAGNESSENILGIAKNDEDESTTMCARPGYLILYTWCPVYELETGSRYRYVYWEGQPGEQPRTIDASEKEVKFEILYTLDTIKIRHDIVPYGDYYEPVKVPVVTLSSNDIKSNLDEVQDYCEKTMQSSWASLTYKSPRHIRFAGLHTFPISGKIEQIIYEIGPQGTFTTVAENQVYDGLTNEQLRSIEKERERNKSDARIKAMLREKNRRR